MPTSSISNVLGNFFSLPSNNPKAAPTAHGQGATSDASSVPGLSAGSTSTMKSRLAKTFIPKGMRSKGNAPGTSSAMQLPSASTASKALVKPIPGSNSDRRTSFIKNFNLEGITAAGATPVETIELGGSQLTPQQVVQIARHGAQIVISEQAMERVQQGFDIVLEAARQGKPVYGLTTGVGQNKDKTVLGSGGKEPKEQEDPMAKLLEQSRKFNLSSIRAHTSGTGEPMNRELVRAGMLIRLNTLLGGGGGVQPAVVNCLKEFLNNDIVPLMPDCGSIGEGDLLLMGHIGLAMSGEWWVVPKNQQEGPASSVEELESAGLDPDSPSCPRRIVHAREALQEAGLDPVELVGKDFLSIISTNSLTAGSAAIGVHDAAQFLRRETIVFALCLQGLNGNVAPFLEASTQKARPFPEMTTMAKAIRDALQDSSLWNKDSKRAMQDPISYRTMQYRLGEVLRGIEDTARALEVQINHSDDNPYVDLEHEATEISEQETSYVVEMPEGRGAIIPTGNFDSLPFAAPVEQLLNSLNKLSTAMASTVLRFESPEITKLPRFLAGSPDGHGFGAVSKGTVGLNDELDSVTTPGRSTNLAVAGGQLEDIATAGPVNVKKVHDAIKKLYAMASYQMLYATQAVDLRGEDIKLSPVTQELYDRYREKVPFLNEDRETTSALAKGTRILKSWSE